VRNDEGGGDLVLREGGAVKNPGERSEAGKRPKKAKKSDKNTPVLNFSKWGGKLSFRDLQKSGQRISKRIVSHEKWRAEKRNEKTNRRCIAGLERKFFSMADMKIESNLRGMNTREKKKRKI